MRKKDKIGIIEKLGQKIPDPVIIFILLYILVLVVTGIFGGNTFSMTSADGIIKSAVETADRRSESIVNEANEKVRYIMEKSQKQIEQDKQNAVTDAKREIASMAVDAAEKIIGKKLTDSDDEELISDIIDRM